MTCGQGKGQEVVRMTKLDKAGAADAHNHWTRLFASVWAPPFVQPAMLMPPWTREIPVFNVG